MIFNQRRKLSQEYEVSNVRNKLQSMNDDLPYIASDIQREIDYEIREEKRRNGPAAGLTKKAIDLGKKKLAAIDAHKKKIADYTAENLIYVSLDNERKEDAHKAAVILAYLYYNALPTQEQENYLRIKELDASAEAAQKIIDNLTLGDEETTKVVKSMKIVLQCKQVAYRDKTVLNSAYANAKVRIKKIALPKPQAE